MAAVEWREQRKTVTVLFCDVTDSTALGESMDPEALRAIFATYIEAGRTVGRTTRKSAKTSRGDGKQLGAIQARPRGEGAPRISTGSRLPNPPAEPNVSQSSTIGDGLTVNHLPAMSTALAAALGVDPSQVQVTAKGAEGLGFAGRGDGIAALAVCLLVATAP